jgi:hypothetical protein
MSNPINQGIKDVSISKRYSDCAISFTLNFIPPTNLLISPVDIFHEGDEIQFNIADRGKPEGVGIVTGQVQTIETDDAQNNIIQTITGRSIGFLLVKQPFKWDCTTSLGKDYTTNDLIGFILEDTGITIGRGQTPFTETVRYNTKGDSPNRFCADFGTKKDALDQLFVQYARLAGIEGIRWFIDSGGYLRWFERIGNRTTKLQFFKEDPNVINIKVKGDAENIINDITVYGGDQSEIMVHLTDEASVNKFGRQIGSSIKDTKIRTVKEVEARARAELKQKAWPFFTATLELAKYYSIDPGERVQFPAYPGHSDRIFTVVDCDTKGATANTTTSVNLTTNETVVSIINEMEIIETVAENKANEAKAIEVVIVGKDPEDPTKVLFKALGSDTIQAGRCTKTGGN